MFNSFLKPAIIIPLISKKNPTMKNTLSKTDVSNAEEVRSVLKITKTHFMFRKKKKIITDPIEGYDTVGNESL